MEFIKNLAHLSHGMLLCFFLLVCFDLSQQPEKNRLLRFLFWEMVFWVFIELKDLIYLHEPWWYAPGISTINLTIDMWTIPATMLFMFEVLSPGWANGKRVCLMMLPSVLFTALFVLTRYVPVFHLIVAYSLVLGTFSLVLVWVASKRYDRFIRHNFSYVENLEVAWLRIFITSLYVMLMIWTLINLATSWVGDIVFYLSSLVLWGLIYYKTRTHRVVEMPNLLNPFVPADEAEGISCRDVTGGETAPAADYDFATRLAQAMETDKLYLDPKLTIVDMAAAVGTNRTYLSDYINHTLCTTFYEYVNTFRVQEASALLLSQPDMPLREVGERCGFGSLSTFRRSFERVMEQTPSEYRIEKLKLPPPVVTKDSIKKLFGHRPRL